MNFIENSKDGSKKQREEIVRHIANSEYEKTELAVYILGKILSAELSNK